MKKLTHSDIGTLAELRACQFLLESGLEVFRNLSPNGPADVVSFDPGILEFVAYDVKTGSRYKSVVGLSYTCNPLNKSQVEMGVKRIAVWPDIIVIDDGVGVNMTEKVNSILNKDQTDIIELIE